MMIASAARARRLSAFFSKLKATGRFADRAAWRATHRHPIATAIAGGTASAALAYPVGHVVGKKTKNYGKGPNKTAARLATGLTPVALLASLPETSIHKVGLESTFKVGMLGGAVLGGAYTGYKLGKLRASPEYKKKQAKVRRIQQERDKKARQRLFKVK